MVVAGFRIGITPTDYGGAVARRHGELVGILTELPFFSTPIRARVDQAIAHQMLTQLGPEIAAGTRTRLAAEGVDSTVAADVAWESPHHLSVSVRVEVRNLPAVAFRHGGNLAGMVAMIPVLGRAALRGPIDRKLADQLHTEMPAAIRDGIRRELGRQGVAARVEVAAEMAETPERQTRLNGSVSRRVEPGFA